MTGGARVVADRTGGVPKAGAVYVEDFNDVDASGRGKACGWVLD